ncbi:MAG: hypothetical protein MJ072_02555, partial [Clostridia bacterium]|nr:hypothetical protein [Clostridia bacterium]
MQVKVNVNGEIKTGNYGERLSSFLTLPHPCGGHGKCGKCKVVAFGCLSPLTEEEKKLLTPTDIAGGVSLDCQPTAVGDARSSWLSSA